MSARPKPVSAATGTTTALDLVNSLLGKLTSDSMATAESGSSEDSSSRKPSVVFVLGGPGAGKGTQCARIVAEFGFVHLSAGDLLRKERDSGSEQATLINNFISEGKIVPVAITVGLIKSEMQRQMTELDKWVFIVDGFPRNADNYDGWNEIMDGFAEVSFLLYLKCSEETMTKRILSRASKTAASSRRVDDNEEAIKKRLKTYRDNTVPIIEQFAKMQLCEQVSSESTDIDAIYNEVRRLFIPFILKPNVVFVLGGPGSGKGTQCSKLCSEFGSKMTHLSAGDLLRAERSMDGSPFASLINDYIREGQIVPVEITVKLIKKAMLRTLRLNNESRTFVIDGFPRNFDNYEGWQRVMNGFCDVRFCLLLDCSEDVMTSRILERAKQASVKRIDDNVEALKKRFKVYSDSTLPVIQEFEKLGKLVRVDSVAEVDEVYAALRPHFADVLDEEATLSSAAGSS